ncbi:MAG TPA: LysM peptidoglycan-binding domain-containing protein [Candidatus Faecimorpha stercoravium]|nr:LysM peptidoglycan-binding domain-containing protein [Candidatus Faecimorpha stercoravium]
MASLLNWTSSVKARKHDINSTDISGYGYPLFDSDEHGTWHMVESSDTLNGIAARYNVPVEWIIKQNHISNPNNIQTGDVFYIPNTEVTEPEEPEDPDVITYIVQEGDTLNDIAARYGTTAQAIADYNGISDVNLIYVGQVLYIPTGSSQSYTTYIVKSGDSLGRIAVSYGLTVAEVAAYNSISDPDTIYVGQEIKIPVSGRRDYIRMFQQAVCDAGVAQITVDGIWGSETASVAVYAEVEKGTVGPLATFAQTMLVAYGYSLPNSGIDGDFWTESVNATIQYQQDHGLVADGIIGIATWKDMLQVN